MEKVKETVKHSRRHRFLFQVARLIPGPFVKLLMGYSCKKENNLDKPYIILANHNSNLDPALVGLGLGHVYFVASEHAFRNGLPSKIMKFVFDPIPISKARTDSSTLREIFRRIKAGFSVCLFAEGNRSFNGVTGPIAPATAKMVKMSGAGLITYRLEGGYFTTPRWATNTRKGKMTGCITGRYSAEEIKSMTVEQILSAIEKGIHENAYESQNQNPIRYRGKNLAQDIETVLYLCPLCRKTGTIHSKGDRFFCDCGLNAVYTETGFLKSAQQGSELPFSTITEWDCWQRKELEKIVNNTGDGPICGDDNQKLFRVDPAAGSTLVGQGPLHISKTELHCAGKVFPLEEITRITIAGQMLLQFAVKDGTQYDIRSSFPRNAIKYREIFSIVRNETRV